MMLAAAALVSRGRRMLGDMQNTPGDIVWYELLTSDPKAAIPFGVPNPVGPS